MYSVTHLLGYQLTIEGESDPIVNKYYVDMDELYQLMGQTNAYRLIEGTLDDDTWTLEEM